MRKLTLLLLAPVLACGSDGAGGGPPDIERLPRLEAVEELRIGSVEDPESGFSRISGVRVDEDGLVYVLEGGAREVRVYDAAGRRVRTIGGEGDGPGEFRGPFGLGVFGDTLWVADTQLRRITVFTKTGELLETIPAPSVMFEVDDGIPGQLVAVELRRDGTLGTTPFVPLRTDMPETTLHMPYVRLTREGEIVDTLHVFDQHFRAARSVDVAGRPFPVPEAAQSTPLNTSSGDAWYVIERPVATSADGGMFTVTHIRDMADTVYRQQYRYTPDGFPPGAVDTVVRRYAAQWSRLAGVDAGAVEARLRQAMDVPAFQPPIARARASEDSVLWLARADRDEPTTRWILIEPDGTPRAALELPRDATVHWSRGDVLWADVRDELDVPWLVRYRLKPAS